MYKKLSIKEYLRSYKSNIFYFILSTPLLILIILIYPFVKIKIGELQSRKVGSFATPAEIYFNEIKQKIRKKKRNEFHLFYLNNKVSNRYIANIHSRNLTILPRLILEPIFFFFSSSKFTKIFLIDLIMVSKKNETKTTQFPIQADVNKVLTNTKSSIKFTDLEILEGNKKLYNLGYKPNQVMVCFANRDSSNFNEKIISLRNADISTYKSAVEYLADKNIFNVRMGRKNSHNLNFSKKNIVDYVFSDLKSDFMDLFIFSKCAFLISTPHGILELATLLRKKRLVINYHSPDRFHWLADDFTPIVLPKKFKCIKNNQYISYREFYEKKLHLYNNNELNSHGYEVVDNSEDEILEAVKEMYESYNNNFKTDLSKQEKFWNNYEKRFNWRPKKMMISDNFFINNYDLFI